MDFNSIEHIVTAIGFPIFCTIVLFWEIGKERKAREGEWREIAKAINENTNTLNILCERLRKDDDDDHIRNFKIS